MSGRYISFKRTFHPEGSNGPNQLFFIFWISANSVKILRKINQTVWAFQIAWAFRIFKRNIPLSEWNISDTPLFIRLTPYLPFPLPFQELYISQNARVLCYSNVLVYWIVYSEKAVVKMNIYLKWSPAIEKIKILDHDYLVQKMESTLRILILSIFLKFKNAFAMNRFWITETRINENGKEIIKFASNGSNVKIFCLLQINIIIIIKRCAPNQHHHYYYY